jgi:outer membrane protein, heavy metal efflux system
VTDVSPPLANLRDALARGGLAPLVLLSLWACASGRSEPETHALDAGRPNTSISFRDHTALGVEGPVPPGPDATLAELEIYALHSSPRLRAAFETWRAALERITRVGSLPDPRFTFAWYVRSVETRVGPMERRYALHQALPWFGKLKLREDMAASAAESERQKVERVRLDLVRDVDRAWLDLHDLARSVAILRENLKLLGVWEGVVRARYAAATATHPDLIRIQIERSRQEDRLRGLADRRTVIVARLNAVLGRESDAVVPAAREIRTRELRGDASALKGELVLGNPELRALEHEARRHGHAADLAAKGFYPDVTLGVEYVEIGDAIMDTPEDGKDAIAAVVSVNVPLHRDRIRAAVREARRRQRSALARRDDLQRRLEADLERALYDVREAERQIALYRETIIPKSREWTESSVALYQAGRVPLDALIEAWRSTLEFQVLLERAFVSREKGIVEIEAITGGAAETAKEGTGP